MKFFCLIFFLIPLFTRGQVVIKPSANNNITETLQTALNSGKNVFIENGEYTISSTITVPANVLVTGAGNAVITADATSGTLLTLMRFFLLYGNNSTISHLTLTGEKFVLDKYSLSAIYVTGAHNHIDSNIFKFNFSYGADVYGIWVSGPDANYNTIAYNKCYKVGIQYAEAGASHNICKNNYVFRAGTDGLQGTGNNKEHPCVGNRVIGNIVDRSGYSGVEDQQKIDSTVIEGNTFTNSGQAKYHTNSMGISAVGTNTLVKNNRVNGFGIYGIEIAGGSGLKIENNTVTDSTFTSSLCFVNMLTATRPGYTNPTKIINNTLYGGKEAVAMEGDYYARVLIEGNKIKNPDGKGIYLYTGSTDAKVTIKNNEILFTRPNTKARYAICTYADHPVSSGVVIEGNKITYLAATSKNKAEEIGILPGHGHTIIKGNMIKTYFPGVYSFATDGNVVNSVQYINNTNTGGKVDLKSFKNTVSKGNNW